MRCVTSWWLDYLKVQITYQTALCLYRKYRAQNILSSSPQLDNNFTSLHFPSLPFLISTSKTIPFASSPPPLQSFVHT